jgi:hypothetical protein
MDGMGKWLFIIVGVLMVLVGGVWTLQGLNIMGGSVMSGVTLWAIIGPIVLILGLALLWRGLRRTRV